MNQHEESSRLDFMKPLLIAAGFAGLSLLPCASSAQQACRVAVKASVEVSGREFSLADLLAPDSCPGLVRAASRVHLGSAPLAGSPRVLAGDDVRDFFRKMADGTGRGAYASASLTIPQRVIVRSAGARASCTEIGTRVLAHRGTAQALASTTFDCGAADRIPRDAPVESTRTVWDAALGSWEVSARCIHPSDCVPFLVRVSALDSQLETARSIHSEETAKASLKRTAPVDEAALSPLSRNPLVRPGETVSLLWDQDGIRVVVPAVCLDRGGPGERVRARILQGGRLISAIVVSAGRLRAAS